jgi:hypothetical protein
MSTTKSTMRRQAIQRTLAQRAGDAPDASVIAEATLGTWRQVATRLTPVIGARGVDVLFSRSLHLTSKAFPWLAIAGNNGTNHTPLASFKACIETREIETAAEASNVLLMTFIELVDTLIGESLTERLLGSVWTSSPPPP